MWRRSSAGGGGGAQWPSPVFAHVESMKLEQTYICDNILIENDLQEK